MSKAIAPGLRAVVGGAMLDGMRAFWGAVAATLVGMAPIAGCSAPVRPPVCDAATTAGASAENCGVFCNCYSEAYDNIGGLDGGVACALTAQDAGQPFTLEVDHTGIDFGTYTVFVRGTAGNSFTTTQVWTDLGDGGFSREACAGFAASGTGLICLSPSPMTTPCQ